MKKTSQSGINLLKELEGCRLEAYKCSAGVWTIGYGHTGKTINMNTKITQAEAENFLKIDLEYFEKGVNNAVKVGINQNQFDSLVCFSYNVGLSAFQSSTMLRKINMNKFKEVPKEFKKWVYAGKTKIKGLEIRREKEIKLWNKKEEGREMLLKIAIIEFFEEIIRLLLVDILKYASQSALNLAEKIIIRIISSPSKKDDRMAMRLLSVIEGLGSSMISGVKILKNRLAEYKGQSND